MVDWKRSISLFCLLLGGAGFAVPASGQWTHRYNGAGNQSDQATAVAMDAQGNVYVTGGSIGAAGNYDYVTIKYDIHGNPLWSRPYNGAGNGNDVATALAVDTQSNVYVTGGSVGSAGNYDYMTIKYDTNGHTVWGRRYNGAGNGDDQATAIAVDTQGNTYVTGYSTGLGTGYDYVTVKYDINGNQLWARSYNGTGNGNDVATALVVDSQGNVCITGRSPGPNLSNDYVTIKYDANGHTVWSRRYNGIGNGDDQANAIAIDGQDNVYITGGSIDAAGYYDYVTIKYDSNGNPLWSRFYNGVGAGDSVATALAVDTEGNVYVTGYSQGSGTSYDYVTIKYDTNGHTVWGRRYNGPGNGDDLAYAIAVDSHGNAYVTGYSLGLGTNYDYATLKFDTNGNLKWVRRYDDATNSIDIATAIAVDNNGNVVVTGFATGQGTGYDYLTIWYIP